MMQEAFGAYRAVISAVLIVYRKAAWKEVRQVIRKIDLTGDSASLEVKVAVGAKPGLSS